MKVSDAMRDPDATAKSVAKIIGTDAALTARLIQVSNSAFARGNSKVENVQMAVSRLGMKTVRNLVTSLIIKQRFHTKYPTLKNAWKHFGYIAPMSAQSVMY
ncbi:MAG: HDOD domain-containing protein [Gammaproteobacteria bacterium]|nr:HDOD domain-containing protein [Gammaproteobacteria bacterium]